MSQDPPPYSYMKGKSGTKKQANKNKGVRPLDKPSAEITGKTGSVSADENCTDANTGIRHSKGGDKSVKDTGDITAHEHNKNGSTGVYMGEDAPGKVKVDGTTGKIHGKNVDKPNTGIIDG